MALDDGYKTDVSGYCCRAGSVPKVGSVFLFQVRSTSAPSAGSRFTNSTTTPETARYLHVSCNLTSRPHEQRPCQSNVNTLNHSLFFQPPPTPRLQKMCATSDKASRQPTVHRGVALTRYCNVFL